MDLVFWYLVAFGLIALWCVACYWAFKVWRGAKALEARGFSLYGPFVMWRTWRGRNVLERIAGRKRFWALYGDAAIVLGAIVAIAMFSLLIWQATLVPSIPDDKAPTPEMMLALPGLNKFIPLGYGVFGLAIAMVVHEGAHGVLVRVGGFKLKSLGVLLLIFPMGAFAEPDEKEMAEGARRSRMRVFASGPAANLLVALVFLLLFTMVFAPCASVAHEGIGVVEVVGGSPAETAGLELGAVVYSFNGTTIGNYTDFSKAIALTRANQTVPMGIYSDGAERTVSVTLEDKGVRTGDADDHGKGYLGISSVTMSTRHFHPVADAGNFDELFARTATFLTLPISGLSPVQGPFVELYDLGGWAAGVPVWLFWLLANAVYWVFWLNLMVGLTNVLPAVPLDGGYLFKDWLEKFLQKIGAKGGVRVEQVKLADKVVLVMSVLILCLIIWPLVGPRIV
jgi:membrane-associated protease RseP (regulator of RpoE activity)